MGQSESTAQAPPELTLVRGEGGADFVGLDNLGNTCYCNRSSTTLTLIANQQTKAFALNFSFHSSPLTPHCARSVLQLLHCCATFRSACLRWSDDMEARLQGAPPPPNSNQPLLTPKSLWVACFDLVVLCCFFLYIHS
jgi:hypothetical protein